MDKPLTEVETQKDTSISTTTNKTSSSLVDETQKESWEELFDERFTNNPVFWAELASEWHQGDIDVKPFKQFISQALLSDRARLVERLEKEKVESYRADKLAAYNTGSDAGMGVAIGVKVGLNKAISIIKESR